MNAREQKPYLSNDNYRDTGTNTTNMKVGK